MEKSHNIQLFSIRNLTTGAWLFNHTVSKIWLRCCTVYKFFTVHPVLCPTKQSVFHIRKHSRF